MQAKVNQLIKISKTVIQDCVLDNGGIVAANSTKFYYPKTAKNYFYIWPRDGSFICMAADILGFKKVQENFFAWLTDRAEDWSKEGLFYEKYYPNGLQALSRFQPDQTGIVLSAVCSYIKNNKINKAKFKKLITSSASGLCKVWKRDHFDLPTNDLWEGRMTFPDLKDSFSYSLGACIKGLDSANRLFSNRKYAVTAKQMKDILIKAGKRNNYFPRSFGKLSDNRIDASALGLIWPFAVIRPENKLAINTIKLMERKLVKDFGVYRHENDDYDGWMSGAIHRKKGAGFWPVLNFWLCIVLCRMNRRKEAIKYYKKVIDSVDKYIPEQIFENKIQQSVSPLAWSHAMFIIASKELGFI